MDSEIQLNIIEKDALRFLKRNNKKYDVVLINLPKPSTIQLNRYYTLEFFQLLKKNINKDAVISLSVSSSGNYMNDEAKKMIAEMNVPASRKKPAVQLIDHPAE